MKPQSDNTGQIRAHFGKLEDIAVRIERVAIKHGTNDRLVWFWMYSRLVRLDSDANTPRKVVASLAIGLGNWQTFVLPSLGWNSADKHLPSAQELLAQCPELIEAIVEDETLRRDTLVLLNTTNDPILAALRGEVLDSDLPKEEFYNSLHRLLQTPDLIKDNNDVGRIKNIAGAKVSTPHTDVRGQLPVGVPKLESWSKFDSDMRILEQVNFPKTILTRHR